MRGESAAAATWLSLALLATGCSERGAAAPAPAVARGEKVYQNVCIACHAPDPSREGSLGPALAGASRALLEAKVVRGEYPPGYEPQRPDSQVMPVFPYLEEKLDDLAAYLASAASVDAAAEGSSALR